MAAYSVEHQEIKLETQTELVGGGPWMSYCGVWAWFPGGRELVKLPSTAFQPPLFLGQSALRQRAHLFSLPGTSLPIISYNFYPNAFHLCPTWMAHFLPGSLFISVMKIVLRAVHWTLSGLAGKIRLCCRTWAGKAKDPSAWGSGSHLRINHHLSQIQYQSITEGSTSPAQAGGGNFILLALTSNVARCLKAGEPKQRK